MPGPGKVTRRVAPLVLVLLGGCGAPAGGPATPAARVTMRDFAIDAPRSLHAGEVDVRVHNAGPDTHELLVYRVPSGGSLPLRRDGLTVDEDALKASEAGGVEGAEAGSTRSVRLDLTPGRYVLLCNMSGHYRGGMHAVLDVR